MTVPLLHMVMMLHRAARRYIIGQISSTERMAPAMLRWLHAEPAQVRRQWPCAASHIHHWSKHVPEEVE